MINYVGDASASENQHGIRNERRLNGQITSSRMHERLKTSVAISTAVRVRGSDMASQDIKDL